MKNKINKFFLLNSTILIILFIISVFIRRENLQEPAGRHHEWLTGHVLTTMSIFDKNGINNYYFSPVLTFDVKAEHDIQKNIPYRDKNNNIYYTSYPPFCFIFPYLTLKLFQLDINLLNLRILNLFIHFTCAILVFFLINRLFDKSIFKTVFIPSIIGYIMYVFSNGNLWFHGNIYFADTLVHVFILSSLYIFISIIKDPVNSSGKKLILLFVFTFLGIYTEWIAVFVAFYMGVFFFLLGFKNRAYFKYIFVLIVSLILPVCLSIFQYTRIAEFELLKEKTIEKYAMRSGYDASHSESGYSFGNTISKINFFKNYERNYSDLMDFVWLMLYLIILLIILNIINRKTKIFTFQIITFGVVFLSIITHHLAFFNFTVVHDFSTLKSSILFTIFLGFITGLTLEYFDGKFKHIPPVLLLILTGWFTYNSVLEYYRVNFVDKNEYYQMVVGDFVKKYSKPDEVVFTNTYATPVMSWYAQRNVWQVKEFNECFGILKFAQYPKGIFVGLVKENESFSVTVKTINNNDTALVTNHKIKLADL